ncbi:MULTISPECIES: hypothetical protein [Rhizobium]|uniref:Mycothiol-dependent maleylpyruvate isomerase metal-binding domain-containing protein n=1 Tax=Rhizobium rhizogenes (strain K84 / ATCC BAA-868) TaxID=311403 RepID=B9JM41_RHIR8|nr:MULTISPECIES: hypothetical protein [Rhizobium]ACM28755.1 Conserved hypothetical protein [Rhizobium rhizogenes K84]EJK88051.1 Mycothiol maleylpyruvate isomerase N-terminal domain-containing protein [Rhizobium sp. AP16]NTI43747.1 maleylpyruvate isomerase [Rhizobium rhizogenes]OCJ18981.1 maleylpyruvate isomerase [Agrobacterium sp. B131/95]
MTNLDAGRAELRERQGEGARYDAPAAPSWDLALARRGTAYFARLLNDLNDAELDAPCADAVASRRAIIAAVGLQARHMAEAIAWCREKGGTAFPDALELNMDNVALTATLPARALRNLFTHAEVHLNVEWRDMTDVHWDQSVFGKDGLLLGLRALPMLRARSLWRAAFDLRSGARRADLPLGIDIAALSGAFTLP